MPATELHEKIRELLWRNKIAILLVVIPLIALWIAGITPVGVIWAAYWPCIFVLQVLIITTPWRVVPLRNVWLMFLIGMGIVPLVTFLAQYIMYALVNFDAIKNVLISDAVLGNYDLMGPVVAPVTEEILKIAPLIFLLCWSGWRALKHISGPLDTALLAGACGAGFGFFENLLRVADNNWGELGPDRVVPVASPQLGSWYIFPDMTGSKYFGNPTVWFGHGEMTAFVGLALGLGLYMRKKTRLWWLIPGAAIIWAIWDHFLVNYMAPYTYPAWTKILPPLDLYGALLPYVFLLGFLYAIYLSIMTQKWYITVDRRAALDNPLRILRSFTTSPRSLFNNCLLFLRFWHLRLAVAHGMRNFSQTSRKEPVEWAVLLATLREQMMAEKAKLIGERAV